MENEIIKYLSKYIPITRELEEVIQESGFIKCYKKGTLLLEEGKISNECYFIRTKLIFNGRMEHP